MTAPFYPALRVDNSDIALVEGAREIAYSSLAERVARVAAGLLDGRPDLAEERIAFLIPATADYVTVMLAIWRAGGIAVPLNVASAISELEHYLGNAGAARLVVNAPQRSPDLDGLCETLDITQVDVDALLSEATATLPPLTPGRRAMMIFTSGTTSKPKGVVHTHGSLSAQITCLLEAWGWSADDVIPLVLPLHHVHGIINVLCCALWSGATVHLFQRFDAEQLVTAVAAGRFSLFMAVPTIYVKLLEYLDALDPGQARQAREGFSGMRLNVSGSAACPVPLFERWRALTGQTLLERYGMTEIGMAISNPYRGERRAGFVGQALPGVEVRLCDESGADVRDDGAPGEIRVRSDNLFLEYWRNPGATREAFIDGWFCTGDTAVREDGDYRIMGRSSIDIIKSGGYKLSALEIEGALLNHPAIDEVAVIGVEDDTWGEVVAACVVLRGSESLSLDALADWCEGRLSSYKVPRRLHLLEALPRNAMGKVTKPELKRLL